MYRLGECGLTRPYAPRRGGSKTAPLRSLVMLLSPPPLTFSLAAAPQLIKAHRKRGLARAPGRPSSSSGFPSSSSGLHLAYRAMAQPSAPLGFSSELPYPDDIQSVSSGDGETSHIPIGVPMSVSASTNRPNTPGIPKLAIQW